MFSESRHDDLFGRPGLIVAARRRALAAALEGAGREIRVGRTSQVRSRGLLELAHRRQDLVRMSVDLVMQPAVPFGRNTARIICALIDDPALVALLGAVVDVAERVRADTGARKGEGAGERWS